MRTILLSLVVLAMLLCPSSAAPLDKAAADEFNHIVGLEAPKPDKKFLSKKGKPPGKPPGPKLFTNAFGILPMPVINDMKPLVQDDDRKKKKHLFKTYSAPLRKEGKRAQFSLRQDDQPKRLLTENQNLRQTKTNLEKIPAGQSVNLHQAKNEHV